MRGDDEQSGHLFSYLSPEQRVPADHPLKAGTARRHRDRRRILVAAGNSIPLAPGFRHGRTNPGKMRATGPSRGGTMVATQHLVAVDSVLTSEKLTRHFGPVGTAGIRLTTVPGPVRSA
jgi:hypothetical protein